MAGHSPSIARSTSRRPGKQFGRLEVPRSTNDERLVAPVRPDRDRSNGGDGPDGARARRRPRRRAGGPGRRAATSRARPSPDDVNGRLIVIPCASMEASHANTRLWPSGANFNRSFPGSPRRAARRAARRLHHALPDRRGRHRDRHAQRRALEPVRRVVGDALGRRRRAAAPDGRRRCSRGTRRCTSSTSTSPAPACSSARRSDRGRSSSRRARRRRARARVDAPVAIDGLRNVLRHFGVLAGEVADARVARARAAGDRARDRRRQLPLRAGRRPLGDARRSWRPRRGRAARRAHPLHRPARPRAGARRMPRTTASSASCARSRRPSRATTSLVIGRQIDVAELA